MFAIMAGANPSEALFRCSSLKQAFVTCALSILPVLQVLTLCLVVARVDNAKVIFSGYVQILDAKILK
jgi:hypothetical protein